MRILFDARVLKKNPSGVGTVVLKLLSHLEKRSDLDIIALTQRGVSEIEGLSRTKVYELDFEYQFVGKERFDFEQKQLPQIVHDVNPDIIHFGDSFGAPISLKKDIKVINTLHDLIPLTKFGELMTGVEFGYYQDSIKQTLERVDRIVCISKFTNKDLDKFFPEYGRKAVVIYNGIDKPILENSCSKKWIMDKYGLLKDYILYIGGFSPRKNIPRLLEAFIKFNQNNNFRLLLPGRFSDKRQIVENITKIRKIISESGQKENIILCDFIPESDKNCLLKNAKIFVYPSLYEGFGLPVLEALSLGTPVITSEKSAMAEIGAGGVIFFNPTDEDDIISAINTMLKNYDRLKETAQKNKNKILDKFNWSKVADEYYGVYKSI